MKRKPGLLWVLVIIFGPGVVTTGYTQSFWERQASIPAQVAQQPQDSPGIAWDAISKVPPPSQRFPAAHQSASVIVPARGVSRLTDASRSTF